MIDAKPGRVPMDVREKAPDSITRPPPVVLAQLLGANPTPLAYLAFESNFCACLQTRDTLAAEWKGAPCEIPMGECMSERSNSSFAGLLARPHLECPIGSAKFADFRIKLPSPSRNLLEGDFLGERALEKCQLARGGGRGKQATESQLLLPR